MNRRNDPNNPGLSRGNDLHGYTVLRAAEIQAMDCYYYELLDAATAARHIHISNSDQENTFSVAFKTVPNDSTGVAHILEHTVLCGSLNYPVRDPFFSMLKRSLNTFMNAFTASDWTMYPFSTQNEKDYYNLMAVYLDAAFFPKLEELRLRQEGHLVELDAQDSASGKIEPGFEDNPHGRLVYKGVVYNEMKGAMSSPDQVMVRSLLNALYPDTTYRHNSGGNPAVIPSLTYHQLKSFHEGHYHPSNAFFYTYGNLPLEKHLNVIRGKVLNRFERIHPHTDVPSQSRWQTPREAVYTYPLGKNEDPARKCQVCISWLMADIRNTFQVLVLAILEQVLLGNAASPLRKALMDAELGTALSDGSGFDADNRDTLFSCGLKDVQASDAQRIEGVIFDCLHRLYATGIDRQLVDAAIHQIEFHRKEVTNTPYPYGIKVLLGISGTWLHGGDPRRILELDSDLEKLRRRLDQGPYLENKIKAYFLENPHRVRCTLAPDHEKAEKEQRRTALELQKIRENLDPEDIQKIVQNTRSLARLQESQEDISCLPTLERGDIPAQMHRVDPPVDGKHVTASFYRQPTAGISYFTAAFGIGGLENDLLPLLPLFCSVLPQIGTAVRDYVEMARRIDTYTGGIGLSPAARIRYDHTRACVPFISLNGKCLDRNQEKMYAIIDELAGRFAFSDLVRLKHLVLEYRAGLEAMVVHQGHRLAISSASRHFSTASALKETWQGIYQLQMIKKISRTLDDDAMQSLADKLTAIAASIFKADNMVMAVIGEDVCETTSPSVLARMGEAFGPGDSRRFASPPVDLSTVRVRNGWATTTAVSFAATTFKTVSLGHEDAPAVSLISKLLRSLYLHREIREKGGAYGGFALYNSEEGLFSMASYRDPHVVSTLTTFKGALRFIRSGNYTEEDVKEAILQVCSEIDKPDPPGAAARKAFYRSLVSLSDEERDAFKARLLGLNLRQVKQVAEKYFGDDTDSHGIAVISNPEKLTAANDTLGDLALKIDQI